MNRLLILNRVPLPWRWPLKWLVFGVVVFAVNFPYPGQTLRHIARWRNPDALIEPDAPSLQPFVDELRGKIPSGAAPGETFKIVERFVYEKIKYRFDWENWGNADYIPTVAEAIERGHEDCDGRAVVAASLLRAFDIPARLVTDFAHVWVDTDRGALMSPGKRTAVVATDQGLKVQSGALAQFPRALAYGVAPFPLERELIIVLALWFLMLRAGGGATCSLVALALLLNGLLLLKVAGQNWQQPIVWAQLAGLANIVAGMACLLIWGRRNARRMEINAAK